MGKAIFISYRRTNFGIIGLLIHRLFLSHGRENVFFDQDSIEGGDNYRERLDEVSKARIVLAIIGPDWEDAFVERRLKNQDDFVLRELEQALNSDVAILPIVIGRKSDFIDWEKVPRELSLRLEALHKIHIPQNNYKDDEGHINNVINRINLSGAGYEFASDILAITQKDVDKENTNLDVGHLFDEVAKGRPNEWLEFLSATKYGKDKSKNFYRIDSDDAWKIAMACIAMANSIGGVVIVRFRKSDEYTFSTKRIFQEQVENVRELGETQEKFIKAFVQEVFPNDSEWKTKSNETWAYYRKNFPMEFTTQWGKYNGEDVVVIRVKAIKKNAYRNYLVLDRNQKNTVQSVLLIRSDGNTEASEGIENPRINEIINPYKWDEWWDQHRRIFRPELADEIKNSKDKWEQEQTSKSIAAKLEECISQYAHNVSATLREDTKGEFYGVGRMSVNSHLASNKTCYEEDENDGRKHRIDLLEVLEECDRAVLLGGPDSVKLLLEQQCLKSAIDRQAGDPVVILIELSKYKGNLWRLVKEQTKSFFADEQLRELAQDGRLKILLNGLNEHAIDMDTFIEDLKEEILEKYEDIKFVLTSTQYDGFLGPDVPTFELFSITRVVEENNNDVPCEFLNRENFELWYEVEKNSRDDSLPWGKAQIVDALSNLAFQSRLAGFSLSCDLDWAISIIKNSLGDTAEKFVEWVGQAGAIVKLEHDSNVFNFAQTSIQECLAAIHLDSHPELWNTIPTRRAREWSNTAFYALSFKKDFPADTVESSLSDEVLSKIAEIDPWMLGRYKLPLDIVNKFSCRSKGDDHSCLKSWLTKQPLPLRIPRTLFDEWSVGFALLIESDTQLQREWAIYCEGLLVSLPASSNALLSLIATNINLDKNVLALGLSKPISPNILKKITGGKISIGPSLVRNLSIIREHGYISQANVLSILPDFDQISIFMAVELISEKLINWEDIPSDLWNRWIASAGLDQAAFWIKNAGLTWDAFKSMRTTWIEQATADQASRWVKAGVLKYEDFVGRHKAWIADADLRQAIRWIDVGLMRWDDFANRYQSWINNAELDQAVNWIYAGLMKSDDFISCCKAWIENATIEEAVKWVEDRRFSCTEFTVRRDEWIRDANPTQAVILVKVGLMKIDDFAGRKDGWIRDANPTQAAKLVDVGLMDKKDFVVRCGDWIEEANAKQASELVRSEILTYLNFSSRCDQWILEATPNEAIKLIHAGILNKEDFVDKLQFWIDDGNVSIVVSLFKAGLLKQNDLSNRRAKWIEEASPSEAAELVQSGLMSKKDFEIRRDVWSKRKTVMDAAKLVKARIMTSSDFAELRADLINQSLYPRNAVELVRVGMMNKNDFAHRRAKWITEAKSDELAILVDPNVMKMEVIENLVRENKKDRLTRSKIKGEVISVKDDCILNLGGASGIVPNFRRFNFVPKVGEILDVEITGVTVNKPKFFTLSMTKTE